MTSLDWSKLCQSIYEGNCILFLGSEFPVAYTDGERREQTSFSKLLSNIILGGDPGGEGADEKELSQVATDYLNTPGQSHEDLETLLRDGLPDDSQLSAPVFSTLAQLPFKLLIDTNYTDFFASLLNDLPEKTARYSYFHFKKPEANPVNLPTLQNGLLCTESHPYVYNLYGNINKQGSLVLSEQDLIDLLANVISKQVPIPDNLKTLLNDPNKCFLFIGFGFVNKDWYFRILLHTLGCTTKQLTSYSPQHRLVQAEATALFFRLGMKTSLYQYQDTTHFVQELMTRYEAYREKQAAKNREVEVSADAPRCFVSYKSEDAVLVEKVVEQLRKHNINAWLDKQRLTGAWDAMILEEIESTNCFLLMQSETMAQARRGYVNREIDKARSVMTEFRKPGDYFFPCVLDGSDGGLGADYPFLRELQNWNLVADGALDLKKISQLASEIRRSAERVKHNK